MVKKNNASYIIINKMDIAYFTLVNLEIVTV